MEPHTDAYIIHIRSKDCDQLTDGFNTDVQVNLEEAISRKIGHRFHLSISSAEIPYVFYNVAASPIKSNQIEVGGAQSLVLEDGNYDIYDLVTAINASAPFAFTITFSEITSKVTLTNPTAGDLILNFGSENSRELAKMLGFDRENQTVLAGTTLTAQGVVNLRPIHSMFLHSDLQSSNVFTTENGTLENILDKVPLGEVGFGQIITYDPYESAPFSSIVNSDHIQQFRLSLRDQNRNLIQLNDARYEISLLVQQVLTYDLETSQGAHPHPEVSRRRSSANQEAPKLNFVNVVEPTYRQPEVTKPMQPIQSRGPIPIKPTFQADKIPQTVNAVPSKRPRIDDAHLAKQEIELQNALLMASALPSL